MTMKYPESPIIEALCEFQFEPGQDWDMTMPGLIYEDVKDEFSIKKQQMGIGFQVSTSDQGIQQSIGPLPPKIQFLREDGSALIQVAPNLLSANMVKPYTDWAEFKKMILDALTIFREIAQPKGFTRIGLRYINRIDFKLQEDEKEIELKDYFDLYPQVPDELPYYDSFLTRIEMPYAEGRDRLLITLGSTDTQIPQTLSIILDFDYVLMNSSAVSLDDAEAWIEEGHEVISTVFESSITDKAREMFRGVEK